MEKIAEKIIILLYSAKNQDLITCSPIYSSLCIVVNSPRRGIQEPKFGTGMMTPIISLRLRSIQTTEMKPDLR